MATGDDASPAEFLDLAWSHVGASSGDLDLPDPIAFADMRHAWPVQREALAQRILSGDTRPADLEVIELPKNELLVRPLARVSLESRLMYEAAVLSIIEKIDSQMSHAVFSHRWLAWDKRLYAPVARWMKMHDEAASFHRANPHLQMARTDVSAFYENIDLAIVLRELDALGPPKWAFETIEIFLKSFNELNNVWGLPQDSMSLEFWPICTSFPLTKSCIARASPTFGTRTICSSLVRTGCPSGKSSWR
ncbi:hypothetical protein ACLQ3F_10620 [Micromonospora sp. DT15]|uniref:hypothetical protein n=1 Tax=Micromonospora sp. DT15 TaxID=3393445 RepID=UPI003CE9F6B8